MEHLQKKHVQIFFCHRFWCTCILQMPMGRWLSYFRCVCVSVCVFVWHCRQDNKQKFVSVRLPHPFLQKKKTLRQADRKWCHWSPKVNTHFHICNPTQVSVSLSLWIFPLPRFLSVTCDTIGGGQCTLVLLHSINLAHTHAASLVAHEHEHVLLLHRQWHRWSKVYCTHADSEQLLTSEWLTSANKIYIQQQQINYQQKNLHLNLFFVFNFLLDVVLTSLTYYWFIDWGNNSIYGSWFMAIVNVFGLGLQGSRRVQCRSGGGSWRVGLLVMSAF